MDDFTERMLERTQRRQQLLASSVTQAPQPTPQLPSLPTIQQSLSPRRSRRTRLAELASQVDQWLTEDQKLDNNTKKIENISSLTKTVKMNESLNDTKNLATGSSQCTITKDIIKATDNKSADIQQPKQYSNRLKKFCQQQQSDDGSMPQNHSPNHTVTSLTVAQRRALFETNIVTQPQIKKPITTTTVTISLTKTTSATPIAKTSTTVANEENEESTEDVLKTPPRPIPCSASTPPSRRGTRPRTSNGSGAAAAASNNLTEQQRVWTPPCIKNVLLKKKLVNELEDDEQMPDNNIKDTAVVTSSPFDTYKFSPGRMVVNSVKFKPSSPSTSLYPDLSLIADDNQDKETSLTPSEIQSMACKRRSNGSSALNISTTSSESVPEDCDDADILGAKRYRCQQKEKDPQTIDVAACQEKMSSSTPVTGLNTTPGGVHCSMLSSHADSLLSQDCSSFTFHRGNESICGNRSFNSTTKQKQEFLGYQLSNSNCKPLSSPLPESDLIEEYFEFVKSDNEEIEESLPNVSPHDLPKFESSKHIVDTAEPDNLNSSSSSSTIKPSLVHTVSTYRKQQQQLRLNGTNSSSKPQMRIPERVNEKQDEDTDDEEMHLQELDKVAARARDLERILVPEQDRIIDQATQALNLCDVYRQKNTVFANKWDAEYVHTERLLLIAGLRRTDAVREAQRLRVERTLLPGGILGEKSKHLNPHGAGKTLVIQSLRVPILSSLNSGGNQNKMKHSSEGIETLTRWPSGYRYFVCAIRAVATVHRPPLTAASRPADALEESVLRFGNHITDCSSNEINYGYVEFITKKRVKNPVGRKCPAPKESEGAPIMIPGLDDSGWKITVELYGVSPTVENDHHNGGNNVKEHDGHEHRSVLDKLWSTVTTPSKDPKKHHGSTASACIESPSGPMSVRNTVFRQLGYFVFSNGQVDRKQFTLNKVHQSGGVSSNSRVTTNVAVEETVRVHMCFLEEGEKEDSVGGINLDNKSSDSYTHAVNWQLRSLKFPNDCKQLEGFLTLFDDRELRPYSLGPKSYWQDRTDVGGRTKDGTTAWRRLWFRTEIIDLNQQKSINNSDKSQEQQNDNNVQQRTIVLKYWLYPEYAEQEREPLGSLDLNSCLPPLEKEITATASGQQQKLRPISAAPALPELCTRPNTLRLVMYKAGASYDNLNDEGHSDDTGYDVLLLAADTALERREWCETINAAANAISEYREQIRLANATQLKKKQYNNEKEQEKLRQQVEHRTGAWPTTPGGIRQYSGKKKKFYN